jgi:hypothetical protein
MNHAVSCRHSRACSLLLAASALLLTLGATRPALAASFSSYAATGTSNYCSPTVQSGGNAGGVGFASAIAPPATTLGSCNLGLVDAMATASAFEGTGQLHAFVSADGQAYASAAANLSDLLTLIPTSGFSASTFQVTFTMALSGTLSGNSSVAGELQVSSSISSRDVSLVLCSGALVAPGCGLGSQFSATIDVLTSDPTVFVQPFLRAFAYNCNQTAQNCFQTLQGSADFAHTAQISLQLPAGFTFTSDSGVFLTQVPEPGEDLLLLLSLGLVGVGRFGRETDRA